MSDFEDLTYALAAYAILAVLGGLVYLAIRKYLPGGQSRLLPLPRRPRGMWTGREVLWVFLAVHFTPLFCYAFLSELGFFDAFYERPTTLEQRGLWAMAFAAPILVALVITGLYMIRGIRPPDLGLGYARLVPNLLAGYLGFLILSPLVYAINLYVVQFTPPSSHALQMILRDAMPVEWGLVFFIGAVGAPISEELVFRGILQGWLTWAPRAGHYVTAAFCIVVGSKNLFDWEKMTARDRLQAWEPAAFAILLASAYLGAIWRSRPSLPPRSENDSETTAEPILEPYLAILGSSALFAAFHGAWPSPIPLFFLSLGLGWLAYRSQSLIGPMIAHGLFNGISCLALLFKAIG